MRLVLVESPCAGPDAEARRRNRRYAFAACRDCLARGEAPYSSLVHFDQPGLLDDLKPEDRELGIVAGLAWGMKADVTVVYEDLGITDGMTMGIDAATRAGRPVEYRELPAWIAEYEAGLV